MTNHIVIHTYMGQEKKNPRNKHLYDLFKMWYKMLKMI